MKENSTLDSKIKKYASLAGTITAAVGTASAQVNYTDLNKLLSESDIISIHLNLNNENKNVSIPRWSCRRKLCNKR